MRYVMFEVAAHCADTSKVMLYDTDADPALQAEHNWDTPPAQTIRIIVQRLVAYCRERDVEEIRYCTAGVGGALRATLDELWDLRSVPFTESIQ